MIASSVRPTANDTREVKPRPSPREGRERAPLEQSQPKRRRPGSPSSAATVTGVVCEAAFFGRLPGSPVRSA